MPAIAKGIHADGAKFYMHLGDFRAMYDFDEDILAQEPYRMSASSAHRKRKMNPAVAARAR